MKRFLALALLLCVGVAVHAQWGVSANAGFGCSSHSCAEDGLEAFDSALPQGWALDFAPRVAYAFGRRLSAGIDLGLGYSSYRYTDGFYSPLTEAWERSEILHKELYSGAVGLFARLQVRSWGRLALHAELSGRYRMAFGTVTTTQYAKDAFGEMEEVKSRSRVWQQQISWRLVPVVGYLLGPADGPHCSVELYLNFVSAAFAHTDTRTFEGKRWRGVGSEADSQRVTDDFGIGLRLLDANPLGVGFAYFF